MKKIIMSLLLTSLCFSSLSYAVEGECFQQSPEAVKLATYGHIDAKGLKALIDSQTLLVLLDGRGNNWHDGNIIPGALFSWYDHPVELFEMAIPSKDSLVVVYCFSISCPLSVRLAERLAQLGYTNVVEYPGGLQEWRDVANYPVEAVYRD